MVKHSPNERLRLLQRTMDARGDAAAASGTQAPPALEAPGDAATQEVLRRAAEVRAAADAQDTGFPTPLNPHVNVNTRRRRDFMADADAIHTDDFQEGGGVEDDLDGSFLGDGFPANPPPWLSQVINAAVTAAATAVAALPPRGSAQSARSSMAPTKLSDRKVPDFWESKPEEWFRIFDAHLAFFGPTEEACFNTLLPLLTPAALSKMTPILRIPGRNPYTRAKTTLLKHFAKTPRDLCRELRELRSLGDSTPSEMLAHIRGLMPDPDVFFEVVLLDLLPANARDAALQHKSLDAMAAAADLIVAENAVAAASPAVSSVSLGDSDAAVVNAITNAVSPSPSDLCQVHAKYGKTAYRCASPATCRMKNIIRQRPPSTRSSPAPGNSKAGSR